MAVYKFNTQLHDISELNEYHFKSEGADKISPQEIVAKNPEIILTIPGLELPPSSINLVLREFATSRGSIDILLITENADIVLIETKLYRNPESHRAVVAQAIDYVKSFSDTDIETLRLKFLQSKYTNHQLASTLFNKESFCILLKTNIKYGNYKVLIIGDKIHSNILGMVESIDSAPHLAFTLYLIELSPVKFDESYILLQPRIVENTNEIERSVIRLEVDFEKKSYIIESAVPSKDNKGSRPIITEEQYIDSLSNPELGETIKSFWTKWKSIGGDIRFGTVGFSSGFRVGSQRIPIQFVMNNRISLISDSYRLSYNIPDYAYNKYKEKLKSTAPKAYDHLIANHVALPFESLSGEDLMSILDSSIELVKSIA